jgi:peroxiredoxin
MSEALGLPFPILRDADLAVTRRYGTVHPKGGPGNADIPEPTTVIVGRDGKVLWVNQYPDIRTRPDPEDLLRILRDSP